MLSVLKAAWRVVARRAIADKAILFASFATILLAITLMSAGPIYADAVTISSLRRALADAPVTESNLAVVGRVAADDYAASDEQVFGLIEDSFEAIGGQVFRRGTSDSQSLLLPGDHEADLVVFRFLTGIEEKASLVDGSWPDPGSAQFQVAVSEPVANALGLEVGSRFAVEGRRQGATRNRVVVSGVYRVDDATDPYWLEDQLDLAGSVPATSYTTYGPLVVAPETFFTRLDQETFEVRWSAFPNHGQIRVEDVTPMVSHLDGLDNRLNSTRELGNLMQVETGLGDILRDTRQSQLVTRSAVLILTIQLAVLAGYALFLASGLLADTRDVETSTLRARGASSGQLLAMSVMEGSLVVLPALALAPFLAAWALRAFNSVGPLAGIGLGIEPAITPSAWALAIIAAIGCMVALVVPSYRSARRSGNVRADRARQSSTGLARRAGVDIALIVIAALGLWQLARYGAPITRDVQGRLGIDPLLVAAPALALLAGTVLALRALPLLARIGELAVARGKHLVASMGIWHLGRQSRRYARSALLLILAVAIGTFALSYDATWQTSQRDQAEFFTGSDVRVAPDLRVGESIPGFALLDAYSQLDGEQLTVPVSETTGELDALSRPIRYLMMRPEETAKLIRFRPDQASEPIDQLLQLTTASRPEPGGVTVPGSPETAAVTVSATAGPIPPEFASERSTVWDLAPTLRLVFADANQIPFRVDMGRLDLSGGPVRLVAPIGHTTPSGESFAPSYPLRLVGIEVRELVPISPYQRDLTVEVADVEVEDEGSWASIDLPDPGEMAASASTIPMADEVSTIGVTSGEGAGVVARINTGSVIAFNRPSSYFMVWTDPPPEVNEIPVLAADALLDELGLRVGDTLPLAGLTGFDGQGVVVGEIDTFPTIDPAEVHPVVLDYATYLAATFGPGVLPPDPEAYWLSVDDTALETTANRLRNTPFQSTEVVTRDEALTRLASDPVSLGTIGSLMMGLVAAAVLAAIGFLVNVVVSTRERLGQFALMRAIGLSTRQLLSWVTLENGITVVFALVFGTLLGLVLSDIVLPLTTVTQQATEVVPELVVVHPWAQIAVIQGVVVASLGVAVFLVARILSRLQLAALLRAGEE